MGRERVLPALGPSVAAPPIDPALLAERERSLYF